MYVEIEAKLRVPSFERVEECLRSQGASFVSEMVQTDSYFDTPDADLARTDQCLRLRVETTGTAKRLVLTYKGPKQADDFKKRKEVNLDVTDAEAVEALLEALGYRRALAFNKKRREWKLAACRIALDTLPLIGTFVEIEGPDAQVIRNVQKKLALTEAPHVPDSYASLIDVELARREATRREVFL
ncbi:MAG TPA: class IV adenylate cyclase [Sedimentisphaerales bacterium]|nr:class IV adenylate cyclase [Sedimentisphaerales bacterium]HRS11642.1 class IV adenylate cyclase [Sedimentisphaerales bacterium]HRV48305.1 class IV adenylate cyclase [Sedimentisphaerales bacterium]